MNKIEKIPTLVELNELLKQEELRLDENYIKYLYGIINLEFSVLRKDVINEEERKELAKISLYRKACIYNIYIRAMELLANERKEMDFKVTNNVNNYQGILLQGTTDSNKVFDVYNFNYEKEKLLIHLYEYQFSYAQREKESDSIIEILEFLYDEENPYLKTNDLNKIKSWDKKHNKRIKNLEYQLKTLDQRKDMPDEDLYIAELKNHFAKLFEREYDIYPKRDYIDKSKKTFSENRQSHLVKNLKCDYPILTLKKEVKYY